jgi:fatty-acyl-CoA synthase
VERGTIPRSISTWEVKWIAAGRGRVDNHVMLGACGHRTVLEALASIGVIDDRGYTFVGEGGRETFVSFRALVTGIYRHAAALQALGFSKGDRLAIVLPENSPFIATFLGALVAGVVPVPMYPPLSLGRIESWTANATSILNVARVSGIVTSQEIRPLLWTPAARANARLVTESQLADFRGTGPDVVDAGPRDLAFLQFTSGSTATPRGVIVSHGNIVENCAGIIGELLKSAAEDVGVSWLPLYHDMGLIGFVLAPLFVARPVVFLSTPTFLKRPSLWFALIHKHRATVTFAPNFAYALATRRVTTQDLARWDLSCLRVVGCGAEPIEPGTIRRFISHFASTGLKPASLRPCYGMAEATLAVTCARADKAFHTDIVDAEQLRTVGLARASREGSSSAELVACGTAFAGHDLRIIDELGQTLPERTVGEIEFRGPSVTSGYFGDPNATASTYRGDALRTGDLGYLADGQLYITGRKKDLIIVRGRNYEPQAIEWSAGRVAGVRRGNVVAFARPGAHGTEELMIVCEATTRDVTSLTAAIRACISDDFGLTVGDVIVLPPGCLPKTSSGKVQRTKTRELYGTDGLERLASTKRHKALSRLSLLVRLRNQAVVGWVRYRVRQLRRLRESARSRAK